MSHIFCGQLVSEQNFENVALVLKIFELTCHCSETFELTWHCSETFELTCHCSETFELTWHCSETFELTCHCSEIFELTWHCSEMFELTFYIKKGVLKEPLDIKSSTVTTGQSIEQTSAEISNEQEITSTITIKS
jgi:hypothetical protein